MGAQLQPSYEGERVNGRMEGQGTYTFTSGTVYTGQFLDGEFHGEGTLQFPGSGKYHATWVHGKAISGNYVFADGLPYTDPADGEWDYCRPDGDRRFYSELVNGLRPAGDSQLCNAHPPPALPRKTWDVGDGYMNEAGEVRAYVQSSDADDDAPVLRVCDPDEQAWAKANCMHG
ncbi:hypothetical protein AB1Y20_019386 [Prymnesium parvum]|uniref:MORN repeat-containing protein 5 n=1 Tax=Prymnesium parvum TaxID=97485 RepID=A0AB34JUG0_PRYPA